MTRKEKVAQMCPKNVGCGHLGGVAGCPDSYPFLDTTGSNITECKRKKLVGMKVDCRECWNMEWPDQKTDRPQWQQTFMSRFMNVV